MLIFVAGHRGMVGSAILRRLEAQGVETITRTRTELDLEPPQIVDFHPELSRLGR
jgi:nucleoside-diphosphate-sugar epimerase